ncbi:acetyl-CoA C-acetyltransferase [Cryobacterium psychrophilum]|uniref:Probable acetyl-CoA acetyltransferase n=1 Tax=Cryobacterium psychrophilum TaxID=41988 RepID=A0A4Y8KPF4_9MICO|nr:acetyl-CoA C-acetyltransferase [Cryobacterium psychrophilum]TDW29135.1 acetyl-CoA C-acetyltransferase [Cryobacterium psychrophilum]TFD77798.1 acetyl-CoA C-acetyltransferase [Cryobacterium psychrophilum]
MTAIDVVILAGSRTPQGRVNGQLASLTAVQLGTAAIAGALARAGVAPDQVDTVLMGQVLQAGAGQNPARQSAIGAGIPWNVPAMTLNKVCLSGLAAIIDAARLVRLGEADVVVAGGQESMSRAPHLLPGSRQGWAYGTVSMLDHAAHDGLTDAFDGLSMGLSTELANEKLGLTRLEQDAVAAASHQRTAAADAADVFANEITPVSVPQRKGDPLVLTTDEGVRGDSTTETLGRLRPAFSTDGNITAGNAAPLSDGASAVVVASKAWAEAHGLSWLAVIEASGQVAGPDNSLHSQPANAIASALTKQGWDAGDLDVVEINEAFASVVMQSSKVLGVSADKVNIHGGGIAMGHPIGASGARVALHAALELSRRGSGKAAVALCGGGGQGEALLLSR